MAKVEALEEELVELKLKKRNFILANKDTKEIENQLVMTAGSLSV